MFMCKKMFSFVYFVSFIFFIHVKGEETTPKAENEPSTKTSFSIEGIKMVLSSTGVEIQVNYHSTESMASHWKKIIVSGNSGYEYWVPITDLSPGTKPNQKETKAENGVDGTASLQITDADHFKTKFIVSFYNSEGNILYEYSPTVSKKDFVQSETDRNVYVAQKMWTSSVGVVKVPDLRTELSEGRDVKEQCEFLVPDNIDARIEWVKVEYEKPEKDSLFVVKKVTVLKSELDWVEDKSADDDAIDVKTVKEVTTAGTLVSSSLNISPVRNDHEGVYTCHLYENGDKPSTFISAYSELLPPLKEASFDQQNQIHLKFFVCQNAYQPIPEAQVSIPVGLPNCFSCGGYGYPRPNVTLIRDGKEIKHDDPNVINIALGKDVKVLMYLMNKPDEQDEGSYSCYAHNEKYEAKWDFEVTVYEEMPEKSKDS